MAKVLVGYLYKAESILHLLNQNITICHQHHHVLL